MTLKVLNEIRDEQRRMRQDIVGLRADVAGLRDEMAGVPARVDHLEGALTTELRAVGAVLVDVRDLLRDRLDVRDTVNDHERRIRALERRPRRIG